MSLEIPPRLLSDNLVVSTDDDCGVEPFAQETSHKNKEIDDEYIQSSSENVANGNDTNDDQESSST